MRFITIQIPVLDTDHDANANIEKMHEELDGLSKEVSKLTIDKPAAISKMFDVIQVMHGFLQVEGKEILLGEDLNLYVEEYFKKANELHIEKIRNYTAVRGWEVAW